MSVTLLGIPLKTTPVDGEEIQHVIVDTTVYEPTAEDNYMLVNGVQIRSTKVDGAHIQHVRVEPGMEQVRYENGYIVAPGMPPFKIVMQTLPSGGQRLAVAVLTDSGQEQYAGFSDYGTA